VVVLLLLTCFYLCSFNRQFLRREGEPPLVSGIIPFLGCALPFGKDPGVFLQKQKDKHGDVFTVYLANKRMHFILDPLAFDSVFKSKKALDFDEIGIEVSKKVFDIPREDVAVTNKEIHRQYASLLSGSHLQPLTEGMQKNLVLCLREEVKKNDLENCCRAKLYDFVRRIIFKAGGETLFGEEFTDKNLLDQFVVFDDAFPLLLAGFPTCFLSSSCQGRKALEDRCKTIATQSTASDFLKARENYFTGLIPESSKLGFQTAMIWASQANTIPAVFWSLTYILHDPHATSQICSEIDSILTPSSTSNITAHELNKMVLLDSAISESFRLSTASMTIRQVLHEYNLELPDGNTYKFRKGDNVCLYPYLMHRDPDIYSDPLEYKFDRFVTFDASGTPHPTKFYKQGNWVKHSPMPFGGGVSKCPGRFFARNEIKLFVALFLFWFDATLLLGNKGLPGFQQTRAGLGILPPLTDIDFEWKLKQPLKQKFFA